MPRDIARRRANPDKEYGDSRVEESGTRERVVKDPGNAVVGEGWVTDRKTPQINKSGSVKRFTYDKDNEVLIKILEAKPFASFWQHWIEKKPYTCLIDNCPLCAIGDTPKPVECYNVVAFGEKGPELFVWQCSANPAKAIKARSEKPRTSPVNREDLYWAVIKEIPDNGFAITKLDPVKAEDLKEDWGTEPLAAEQLAEFAKDAYTKDIVQVAPRHELVELANSLE